MARPRKTKQRPYLIRAMHEWMSHSATRALVLGNDEIAFEARFDGVARQVSVPVQAVLGIYARETGQGMVFAAEDSPQPSGDAPAAASSRPTLKVVK
jgi:stringent starvation protein B